MNTSVLFAIISVYINCVCCHFYYAPPVIPYVYPDGHIADTHEVAAAKAQHFAAVAEAKAQQHSGYYSGLYAPYHGYLHHDHSVYHPVVLPTGYLADTQEVAAAKHHHLEAVNHAHARDYHAYHSLY